MLNKSSRRGRKAAGWGLAAALFILAAGVYPASERAGERDICKEAMVNCLVAGLSGFSLVDQVLVLLRLEYCLNGFDFCRRYVVYFI